MKYAFTCLFLFFSLNVFSEAAMQNTKSIYQLNQSWTTQDNIVLKMSTLRGHPVIATMVFTSCPGACPLMISDMKLFEILLKDNYQYYLKNPCFN